MEIGDSPMSLTPVLKLKCAICPALISILIVSACTSAQAAPLATISMEGRKQGELFWSRVVIPAIGDVIEYRLVADMQPVGATNGNWTITSLANSGLQSLSLSIVQAPTDLAQVDFNPLPSAAEAFRNGWGNGTGASSGTVSPRAGSSWNDVRGIRAIHPPGVFSAVDPEVVIQGGTFRVAEISGPVPVDPLKRGLAVLWPTWGTASGAMRINGAGQLFITPQDQAGADPLVTFEPLILQAIPEPSTVLLSAVGAAALFGFVHRRRGARRVLGARSTIEVGITNFIAGASCSCNSAAGSRRYVLARPRN
jgi:hypothetical protein